MATKPTETPARRGRKATTKPAAIADRETSAKLPTKDELAATPVENIHLPAINAELDVNGPGYAAAEMRANNPKLADDYDCPVCSAYIPEIPGVSAIADVFAASGYFPGKTTAQIATQIIAGRSLGMDPAQSMFDLEITPHEITYKIRRSFEKAADDKAAIDTAIINAFDANDRATPKTAAASNVVDIFAPAIPPGSDINEKLPDHIRRDIATDWNGAGPDPGDIAEINDILMQKDDDSANLANKGPLLDPEPETGQPEGPGSETQSAAAKIESAAAIELISEPDPGEVSPDMAATAFSAIGVDVMPAVDMQRNAFGLLCRELGLDVEAKLNEYDNADYLGQQKKFTDCQKYYAGKVDVSRTYVLDTLAADGKSTTEMQKGFFMYADVGLDPTIWTYTEAVKAQAAIADFFRKPAA